MPMFPPFRRIEGWPKDEPKRDPQSCAAEKERPLLWSFTGYGHLFTRRARTGQDRLPAIDLCLYFSGSHCKQSQSFFTPVAGPPERQGNVRNERRMADF